MTAALRFISKPQEVEATRWIGTNVEELWDVFTAAKIFGPIEANDYLLLMAGKDGAQKWVPVPIGHWIVRKPHDNSDLWPCDDEYFQAKYASMQAVEELVDTLQGTKAL